MHPTVRDRSMRWIWIALFAVLMNALAPAVSQALGPSRADFADGQICSARNVTADASTQQHDPQHADKLAACGYCVTHAASFGLPPPELGGFGLSGSVSIKPFLFYRAPTPLIALSAAPPRGPPSFA